jgi:VWFA-related protein
VVRISITLVQIDAVVTDQQGKQVTNLKPSDFDIYEDGRRQQITNFSYVVAQPDSPAPPKTEARSKAPAPIGPLTRLRPDQVRRTVALVVDDLGLSFESTAGVRAALKKFVDEQMQAGDLVAIIRTGAGMGALQQFTSDKRQLYAAISGKPLGSDADTIDEFRAEIYSVGTLGALNFVVRGLREFPGRKSVILFSDGFKLFNREQNSQRVLESLRRLTDLANRASVVVYTIDARGLQPLGPTAADDMGSLDREQIEQRLESRRAEMFDSQEGLQYLAQETGGFFVRNTNDIGRGIKRVLDDQSGYYLIGYVPEQATFKLEQGRRKFHKISVNVKTAGLRVRSRTGFYGIADEEAQPVRRTPAQQVTAALMSPFASGDVHLRLTSLFGHDPKAGAFVRSLLHIDARDLTFTDEPGGWYKSVMNVVAVTFGDNGHLVDQESRTYTLQVRKAMYKQVRDRGFLYTVNLPVKKPGAYQMRVAVRDSASERVGSANQFIDVPDLGKNRLTLSGLVLSGSDPARANKTATVDANDSAQQTAGDKEGAVEDFEPLASPAVRMLRRGFDLDYAFLIFNAQSDPKTKQPQLDSQVVLLKDGKQVFSGKVSAIPLGEQPDLKHIPASGRLRLGTDLAAGEYVLQIINTDKLAKEKYRAATQWMDFEIVE